MPQKVGLGMFCTLVLERRGRKIYTYRMKYIELSKEKPDIAVLLHGGGLDSWSLMALGELLASRYHVVLPTIPGHGGDSGAFLSVRRCAEELAELINTGFGGHVALLGGLSLGAQIALETALISPGIADILVLESPSLNPQKAMAALVEPSFRLSYPLVKKRWFSYLQGRYLGIPEPLLEQYYTTTAATDCDNLVAFTKASALYEPGLKGPGCPLLLLRGGRERGIIKASAKKLKTLTPEASVQVLPGLRHGELSLRNSERYRDILWCWESGAAPSADSMANHH